MLFQRHSCLLAAVAVICTAGGLRAEPLPIGAWKVSARPDGNGHLIIKAVKDKGELVGEIFGKPIQGTWNGTRLSFKFHDVTERWYEAWLVKEQQDTRIHYTLTGVRKFFTAYPVKDEAGTLQSWYTAGGWYAQLEERSEKK